MDYVLSLMAVEDDDFTDERTDWHYLKVPPEAERPLPTHTYDIRKWFPEVTEAAEFEDFSLPWINQHMPTHLVLFIGGGAYSGNKFLASLRRFRAGLEAAGFQGCIVGIYWGAAPVPLAYSGDRRPEKYAAIEFAEWGVDLLIEHVREENAYIDLHIVAHETGAYLVREAFDHADDMDTLGGTVWTFSQIMFLGADVSAVSMAEDDPRSASLYRRCVRLTNYQNGHDDQLSLVSVPRVGVAPRLGRVGLPEGCPDKGVNVDVSPVFATRPELEVSYFDPVRNFNLDDPALMRDMVLTILGTKDRTVMPTRHVTGRSRAVLTEE